ncbi:TonB-dependent receptor [Flagellimonas sp.]|uniref:TonB-dependent receptor n=1 Tax=Flagellimonas sp. TaxID=2058762 RepID=UPI003B51A9FF
MKKLLFILILIPLTSWGQERTIQGIVTDGTEPLPGVNILEKGTTNGVTTDFNGNFEISVSFEAILVFSYLGFETQEITSENEVNLNIVMKEDAQQLDGVEVLGFAGVIGKARKRTASIQTTPESVTAFNSDGIEKIGINNVTTFANLVPNLKLSESQAVGVNSLVIRGIPQIRNTDAPVAFVIDGVTIADPSLLNQELFDLALIEVVKGPQGALYGKNAIGGAINIYSKEPTNVTKNKITVGYGNGNAFLGRFISSGAIQKDKVFYRVSAQYRDFDGLLNNEFLDEKVDFKQELTLRGQLMFRFSPNFKASLTTQYINSEGGATYYSTSPGAPAFIDANDGILPYLNPTPDDGNNVIFQDILGESDLKNFYGNLNLEWNLGNVKLQSITSYSDVNRSTIGDLDMTVTEDWFLDQGETNDTQTFNQEIRLTNRSTTSKLDWSFGGFFQTIERPFFQSDFTFSDVFAVTDYVANFQTIALFGFMDYKLSDKLTGSIGLRFDSDKFELEDFLNGQTDEKSEDVLQPKASLSYQATENTLLYSNYGRGYRAGGFNPRVTDLFNRDFEGEFSNNFEIGFKTSSWGNRFILNGSVFYSDFKNRQQFAITFPDFTPGNFNYEKSEITGFEIDTKTRVSKYLDVLFNYGYVKSIIKEGGSTGGADGMARDLNQFNDNNTSLVPQSNFNLGLESSIPFNEKTTLDLSINYNGTGKIYWEDSNADEFTSDAYQLLDAQARLTSGKVALTLWARNILDEQYYLEYTDFGIGWRGTPATVGTTLSVSF